MLQIWESKKSVKYISGLGFITSARMLEEELQENKCPEGIVKMFDMHMAQLGLAIKSDNRF